MVISLSEQESVTFINTTFLSAHLWHESIAQIVEKGFEELILIK